MAVRREKCRSCGRPIVWATNHKGSKVPFDVVSTEQPHGAYVLRKTEEGVSATPIQELNLLDGNDEKWFTSHFATCPQADRWRKKS